MTERQHNLEDTERLLQSALPAPVPGADELLSNAAMPAPPTLNQLPAPTAERIIYELARVTEGGYAPHFAVNGVKFLPFEHRQFAPGENTERFVRFLRNNDINSVMIADTSPTEAIAALASEIGRQGLTLHYRDHHSPAQGIISNETLRRNAAQIELIARRSGGTFRWETRDEYPTCSMLLESGDLLKLKVGAYICVPCDIDGLGTYVKGVGLRYDSFPGSAHSMELDIAMIDSPQSRKTRSMLLDQKRKASGSSEGDFQHQMLPASQAYLQAYGGIALNPSKFKHNLYKLNVAFVESLIQGGLETNPGQSIRSLGDVTRSYDNVLRSIISTYAIVNGPIVTVNLANLTLERDMKEVLASKHPEMTNDELCANASALIGRKSSRVHTGRVKQLIREICQQEWGMSSDLVIALITSDQRKTWQCHVEGIGLYSKINFGALNRKNHAPMFRTILGSRAIVNANDIGRAMSVIQDEVESIEALRRQGARNQINHDAYNGNKKK